MSTFRLIYHSESRLPPGPPGERALQDIVQAAGTRNAVLGITGVLFHDGAHFTQVLEGPREAINELFDSITEDRRHADITVLSAAARTQRDFAAWPMALVTFEDIARLTAETDTAPGLDGGRVTGFVPTMARVLAARVLAAKEEAAKQSRP